LVIRDSLRFAVRWEDLADQGREVDLSEEMMLITASIILKAMFSSETPESITQMNSAVETMITYVDTQMVPVRVPTWLPSRRNHHYFEARDLVHGSIAARSPNVGRSTRRTGRTTCCHPSWRRATPTQARR
jgi:hypothetical protein